MAKVNALGKGGEGKKDQKDNPFSKEEDVDVNNESEI